MPISNADLPRIGQLLWQCVRAVEIAKVKMRLLSDVERNRAQADFNNARNACGELLAALTPSKGPYLGLDNDNAFDRCLEGSDADILEAELDSKVSEKLTNLWEFLAANPAAPFAGQLAPERRRRKILKYLEKLANWLDERTGGGPGWGTTPTPARTTEQGKGIGQNEPLAGAARKRAFQALELAVKKAYLAFDYAESKAEGKLEDKEAYQLLKEEGIPQENSGLLANYELPDFGTWTRYLRKAREALGEQKYQRRGRARPTRSIVTGKQIENQTADD
jgi:hypothetical protein